MTTRLIVSLAIVATLAGCGNERLSRFNPLALFTRETAAPIRTSDGFDTANGRLLVDQIADLGIEPMGSGAILRVTGLPLVQGHYDAALVPAAAPPGVLAFEMRARPPLGGAPVSTPASREMVVAVRLGAAQLAAAREIRVAGARNARALRR